MSHHSTSAQHVADPARDVLRAVTIPPRPALLMALQREIRADEPQIKKIAALISRDVAMAGKLLQTANSPAYAARRNIVSVEEAIAMLGMNQCGAVMTDLITRSLMAHGRTMMARFWDVSEKRAKGMVYIARLTRAATPEMAHTFGLFCDIGIPLLKAHFPTYVATLALANRTAAKRFTEVEQSQHGVDHAMVGALLAEQWGLDTDIVTAIRLHHSYEAFYDETIPATVRALLACNLVVEKTIQAFRGETSSLEWSEGGAVATEVLDLSAAEVDAACAEIKRLF